MLRRFDFTEDEVIDLRVAVKMSLDGLADIIDRTKGAGLEVGSFRHDEYERLLVIMEKLRCGS